MAHISGLWNSASRRQRLEASSWLALRAEAQSASSVQSVGAHGASWRDASTLFNFEAQSSMFVAGGGNLELKSGPRPSKAEDGFRQGKAQPQRLVFMAFASSFVTQGASWREAPALWNLEWKSSRLAAGGEHLALKSGPRLSKAEDSCRQGKTQAQKATTRNRQLVVLALSTSASFNSAGGHPASCGLVGKVMANPSLNRTHCGVPPFGL